MNRDHPTMPDSEKKNLALRQAVREASALLRDAARRLNDVLQDEPILAETPMEAHAVMESSIKAMGAALRCLDSGVPTKSSFAVSGPGGPTRQQGQFLAFIREYMLRNEAGVAPSHANFQRFFNLTPPSVNSMLNRLEQRGFIRRVPHTGRAIELILNPDWIPPLDRPFKF